MLHDIGSHEHSATILSEQHNRYVAGSPENITPPSSGVASPPPPPARSAYSTGDPAALTAVSETAAAAPEGAYEAFGSGEDAGYDEASGCGGGGGGGTREGRSGSLVGGLGDETAAPDGNGGGGGGGGLTAHQAWKRKAMEYGIEFVSTQDKYFEGFEKSEVEEDEEELKRRGGIGYRQFYETGPVANGYDAADLDGGGGDDGDDGDGDGESLDDLGIEAAPPNGAVRRGAAAAGGDAGAGGHAVSAPAPVPVPVPEKERRFDRREMLQKASTRGREALMRDEHDGSDDDMSSETSDLGEEAVNNDYTGFDTASESSSMFSAGRRGGQGR